jgi:hypothetical protein
VPVGCYRVQREQLRGHTLLEIDHQSSHVGLILAHANPGDERVFRPNLADQLPQRAVQLQALNIDHQSGRVVGDEVSGGQM